MLRKKKSFSVEVIVIETIVLFYHKKRKKNSFANNKLFFSECLSINFARYFHQLLLFIPSLFLLLA